MRPNVIVRPGRVTIENNRGSILLDTRPRIAGFAQGIRAALRGPAERDYAWPGWSVAELEILLAEVEGTLEEHHG